MKQLLRLYTKQNGKLVHFNAEVPEGATLVPFMLDCMKAFKDELPGCLRVLALVPPRLEQIELFPELRGIGK